MPYEKHMRILSFAFIFLITLTFQLAFGQSIKTGAEAQNQIHGAELIRTHPNSQIPSFVRYHSSKRPRSSEFLSQLQAQLKLDSKMQMILIQQQEDHLGFTHYKYQQQFNQIPVEFTSWSVHVRNGLVESQSGFIHTSIPAGAPTPQITTGQAIQYAVNHIGAQVYKWEIASEEAHIKHEQNNPEATYYPQPELVYVPGGSDFSSDQYHLAYKMNIYAHSPLSRQIIYVNASNGNIERTIEQIHHSDVPGTAITAYSGIRTIIADSTGPGNFRLREYSRGNGVETFNMQQGTTHSNAVDFTDADNYWNNVNPQFDQYATDAHWGAEMTYDYFLVEHNRNSIDNMGFTLKSYVHFDNGYNNAFWDGQRMTYGDGNGAPLTSIDIAGHEITHGLTSNTADLIYSQESGALNESFSDIFAVTIEKYGRPNNWNWLLGEDLGSPLRSLSNPNSVGDPDTYFGNNWASLTGGDNGGVHTNSSVQNYWFHLLSDGGAGTNDNGDAYNITGIGIEDAADVAFRNLTIYLTPSSNFADARFFAIQSAIDLFGACTPNVGTVTDAWYAVGVGQPYVPYTLASFSVGQNTSCTAPFTVNFQNNSINGQTYTWNFGDGNTSTQANPTHTYTSMGSYQVTLNADGGACGVDDTIQPGFIVISDTLPCIVSLPAQGIATTQTSCTGIVYDDGGPQANYSANSNSRITISPAGAQSVTITFPHFDIEPGQGNSCNFDYIRIYDGPNVSSPVIDTYCNNNIPSTVTSTTGSVTVEFYSDGGLELSGFEMHWQCNLPNTPPKPNFANNIDSTCSGDIVFTDLSSNNPTSWLWDFGDGQTSTAQNPTHHYANSGTYSVSLTATNAFGNQQVTKSNLVTITYVGMPTATSTTVCPGNSDTLIATSNGLSRWFDDQYDLNPVFVGDTFITPALSSTTSFYLEQETQSPSQFLGPVDNSIGPGGNFNGDQSLVFDVQQAIILESVEVYAAGGGIRNIELRDAAGTVIDTANVFVGSGQQTVNLNFEILPGTGYQLGVAVGSQPALYRNNTGASFPYTIANMAAITGSTASAGYYYFFYNWKIKELTCLSPRIAVDALVDICASVNENDLANNISIYPNPTQSEFNIVIPSNLLDTGLKATIINSLGQVVTTTPLQTEKTLIHTSSWAKGIYLIQIPLNGQVTTYRLIVD